MTTSVHSGGILFPSWTLDQPAGHYTNSQETGGPSRGGKEVGTQGRVGPTMRTGKGCTRGKRRLLRRPDGASSWMSEFINTEDSPLIQDFIP